ncbi:MAG: RNA pyrophosphohydrolase [Rhodospirillales bacterium]
MNAYDDLPEGYRPCAGAAVFNGDGHVFLGCRVDQDPDGDFAWQMPQGGLDKGEDPERAARRELEEETGIRSVILLAETDGWLAYDFPPEILGKRFRNYRGQAQKWYAYGFTGDVDEIDLTHHGEPEFQQWDWVPLIRVPGLIVPFKRHVYEAIVTAFQPVAGGWKGTRG